MKKSMSINFKDYTDKETTQNLMLSLKYKTGQDCPVVINKALRLYNIMINAGGKII